VVIHLGYYIGLSEAYRTGDMGQVYPIARGAAPLMTAIGDAFGRRARAVVRLGRHRRARLRRHADRRCAAAPARAARPPSRSASRCSPR
jgi:hypothetical protein